MEKRNVVLLFVLFVVFFSIPFGKVLRRDGGDFSQYYEASQRLIKGQSIYEKETGIYNVYSPFFITAFLPLSFADKFFSFFIWYWFKVIVWIVIVYFSLNIFKLSFEDRRTKLILFLSFLFSSKFILPDFEGQVNNIVFFFVFLSFLYFTSGSRWVPAFFLSLAVSVKPFAGLMWIYFLAKKSLSNFLLFPLFYLFLNTLIPAFIVKEKAIDIFFEYIHRIILPYPLGEFGWFDFANISFPALVARFIHNTYAFDNVKINFLDLDHTYVRVIITSIFALSFPIVYFFFRRRRISIFDLGIILILSSVFSPLTERHHVAHIFFSYFCVLYFMYFVMRDDADNFVKVIVFLSGIMNVLINSDILGVKLYRYLESFGASLVSILILLFVLLRFQRRLENGKEVKLN